jgi:hypothetical protein
MGNLFALLLLLLLSSGRLYISADILLVFKYTLLESSMEISLMGSLAVHGFMLESFGHTQ